MIATENKYSWVDRKEYPFGDNYFLLDGNRMHYVDEGTGEPVVFVHGTPSWSWDFRSVIKEVSKTHRCIAMDHIGFGLSDKPENYPYSTLKHSENLEAFISHLGITNITLVVHDFGGPIGLNLAIKHPGKIKRLVILNTWLWSTKEEPEFKQAEVLLKSPLLPLLYKYFNFSARFMVPQSWGDKKTLTKEVHAHYLKPFSKASERMGTLAFAKSLLNDLDWYESLWAKVDVLTTKPTLFLWGEKDKFMPLRFLTKFLTKFKNAEAVKINAGHFVQDEAQKEVTAEIKKFLGKC